jgi:uroporphyrinogen decarboxylase
MNSRERVLAALDHEEPDRVPVDFGGHRSSGIMATAYARLKEHLGIEAGGIYVYDLVQQLAIVEKDVLDRFGVDITELGRGFARDEGYWADWELPDGTPCKVPAYIPLGREGEDWFIYNDAGDPIAVQRAGSLYFEQLVWPYMDSDDEGFEDLEERLGDVMWVAAGTPPAPLGFNEDDVAELRRGALALRQSTDRAIVGLFGGNLNEIGQFCFRIDNFLRMLIEQPQRMHRFLDRLTEMHLRKLEMWLGAVGDCIDVIMFGDDLGMQTGPQMSPAMYDEFFAPRHARMWRRAKELAGVKVMLHCCGGIRPLLPSLIEAGMDATNPVQTNCAGMDAAGLKRDFGERITLWGGGCDTRAVLPRGTPDEVRAEVRERVRTLSPGGGFVFQQVHNIMADVPPENVVAMFDAVREQATRYANSTRAGETYDGRKH